MPDEQNIERIAAYIEQHRAQYDLDALRQQLLAAGYSADDIDAAVARNAQPQPEALPASQVPPVAELAAQAVEPDPPAPAVPAVPVQGDDQRVKRMVEYLRQNATTYNLNALRRQLIAQGERPELVDAALARVWAEMPAPEGRLRPALPWAGGTLVLALIGAGLTLIDSFDWLGFGFVATLIYGALGALLLLVGAIVQAFRRRIGLAMIFGGLIALSISALAVVIFFGICLVLLSQSGL